MDDNFNATHITFDGYVQVQKYRYLYFLMMFTLYVLIICSNSTIVYLIWIHRNLHEPMYIFIAALSTNSILFSSVIYPKILVDVLSERQIIPYSACLFQWFLCYSLGLSDFLILAAMAYDRYVSICKPLQHPLIMKKSTITALLLSAWLVPALTLAMDSHTKLCSFILNGIYCNNLVTKLQCVIPTVSLLYGFVVFVNIAILPVLFILFTYTKILIISYRSSRDVRRKAAETCLPHLFVLISFSAMCAYDVIIAELKLDFQKTVRLMMSLQVVLYSPLLNPIIYGVKVKEISKHIKKMLCHVRLN
uniref:Olfactory receptor n=1 Tax=Stegastes partitus TaxID=144197 RepID=A0A3B4ZGD1_9TELE